MQVFPVKYSVTPQAMLNNSTMWLKGEITMSWDSCMIGKIKK